MAARRTKRTVAVLGTGSWGTALALVLARNGHDVRLWGCHRDTVAALAGSRSTKYLPGIEIPDSILVTDDVERAVGGADFWINAVPTKYIREVMRQLRGRIPTSIPAVSAAKGIENRTLLRASQVILDVLGRRKMGVLAGPSHAEEVSRRVPTTVVVASTNRPLAETVQSAFQSDDFRVYTNDDFFGVEMGGALKNVVAIAAGICDGLGFGDNAKAALITRGIAEIARLGVALGARKSTFSGLSGIGDLIVTCISRFGRNRAVGEEIGRGKRLREVLDEMEMVAEGVWTTKSAVALAEKHGVEMPITEEVYRVLFRNKRADRAVRDLMRRDMKAEEVG
jgi:glycerol-3-phosphate dehydrogenase (NAD(P)+)